MRHRMSDKPKDPPPESVQFREMSQPPTDPYGQTTPAPPRPATEKTRPADAGMERTLQDVRAAAEPEIPSEVTDAAKNPKSLLNQYVLTKQLGKGGMGTVWKAFDRKLLRWVAIKFLHVSDEDNVRRFMREAQLAARLRHPNIAPIYEVGESDGKPFIAMEYIDGTSMDKLKLPLHGMLDLFAKVCAGVDAAHRGGVVHRDLKPQNVMITSEGWPYVMDFGLAKALQTESSLSVSGAIMGTPAYMPPEQAEGKLDQIDARSDVYALGATLYVLLTRKMPFSGQTPMEILMKVCKEDTVPPTQVAPDIPKPVETIILKAMAKAKADRYESAAAMGEDIKRFLAGTRIAAVAPPPRRPKRAVWPIAAVTAFLVAGGAIAFLLTRPSEKPPVVNPDDPKGKREEAWLKGWLDLRRQIEFADWSGDAAVGGRAQAHLATMAKDASIRDASDAEEWLRRQLSQAEGDARHAHVGAWAAVVEGAAKGVEPLKRVGEQAARLRASAEWQGLRDAIAFDAWKPGGAVRTAPAAAAGWMREETGRVRASYERIKADRASWAANRATVERVAAWCEMIGAVCAGVDALKDAGGEAGKLRADTAAVLGYRGSFTLVVAVGPWAEITKLTRGGQAVPVAQNHTPVVLTLEVGDYELELTHPAHGAVPLSIASKDLRDGRTYRVSGMMREKRLAFSEAP